MTQASTFPRTAAATAAALLLAGCAATSGTPDPRDPWEGMNRSIYAFNDTVDRAVLKPVATAYQRVTPRPVRSCAANFFGNLRDVWYSANSFLQGQVPDGINMVGRVLMNTTVGGLGCFDVATDAGVPSIPRNFGSTLGVWGLPSGPYLVLPLLGPSTVRDTAGVAVDSVGNVLFDMDNIRVRNSLLGFRVVSDRERLLETGDLVDDIALDPYSFVRDAYLQRRQALINQSLGKDALPDYNLPDYDDPADTAPAATPARP
ncbi:VacJ family lipoprotein [Achromobacter sp. GG226]|uniref:MlaA family lipoprotein n=1 Tax=Verticiella alkaliphila TaxID=2779529 RepID=UPI001C0C4CF1|nr:VacJ family lipoprotein [Verticiella sp. GG226]MBU4610372.1 VacJ family lipoprotein [Verticiella sp. GG226]